jgi:hypothetical protein
VKGILPPIGLICSMRFLPVTMLAKHTPHEEYNLYFTSALAAFLTGERRNICCVGIDSIHWREKVCDKLCASWCNLLCARPNDISAR